MRPLLTRRIECCYLIRLGSSIGLAKALEWYNLRRGSDKKLNGTLLLGSAINVLMSRQKLLHRQGDSGAHVQCYMSNFNDVDRQSIYFKSLPQHDRIHLAGRLLRHAGTRGQPGPESCEVTLEANPCTSETDTSRLFRIDSCRGNRFLQVFASFSNAIRP